MKKYLILCLIPVFLCLISAKARAFELKEWLEDIEGALVVYVDEEIIIEDTSDMKICFLSDPQKYQGFSVQELFDKALKQLPLGPRMDGKFHQNIHSDFKITEKGRQYLDNLLKNH